MRDLVLVGLSGSGKTTLGQMVAQKLELPFVDLDEIIAKMAGLEIPDIFEEHGEEYFRALETQAVREVSQGPPCVIATGGGTVLRKENVELLRERGYIVFLDRAVENIERDIDFETRPLLAKTGLQGLYRMAEERRQAYLDAADTVLPNTGELDEVAGTLAGLLETDAAAGRQEKPVASADLRKEIDGIDDEIFALFVQRMAVVRRLVDVKRRDGLPVTDAGREQQIMNRALAAVPEELHEFTGVLVRTLLDLSRRYQAPLLEDMPREEVAENEEEKEGDC